MKQHPILITIISVVICLSLAVVAVADIVPWSTENYTAYVHGEEFDGDLTGPFVTVSGPPLPVTASDSANPVPFIGWDLNSTITSSTMTLSIERTGVAVATASAEFLGIYTADSSNPLFNFTYSLTESASPTTSDYWFYVNDLTDGVNLYSNASLSLSSNPISILVPTIAGHDIEINYNIYNYEHHGCCTASYTTTMTYAMSVVPEPISSILFVAGGTLLAGRRYIKRKKTA